MDLVTKIKNQYTRGELYNYLKSKDVNRCTRLKEYDLIKKIIEQGSNHEECHRFNEFKFDDSIFNNSKPDQRSN